MMAMHVVALSINEIPSSSNASLLLRDSSMNSCALTAEWLSEDEMKKQASIHIRFLSKIRWGSAD